MNFPGTRKIFDGDAVASSGKSDAVDGNSDKYYDRLFILRYTSTSKMIKLIASDLDGTLLPEGTADIHPEFYDVIRCLKKRGIAFVAASGREIETVRTVMGPVMDDIYCIANNGARIVEYDKDELSLLSIDYKTTADIVKYLRQYPDISFAINTSHGTIIEHADDDLLRLLREGYGLKYTIVDDVLANYTDNLKVSAYVKMDAAKAAEPMIELFGNRVNVTAAGEHWVDFIHKRADKGSAFSFLREHLGIDRGSTWAFGDNHNDITMLRAAGKSFAAPGAREAVCDAADVVLDGSLSDAVLNQIKTLL